MHRESDMRLYVAATIMSNNPKINVEKAIEKAQKLIDANEAYDIKKKDKINYDEDELKKLVDESSEVKEARKNFNKALESRFEIQFGKKEDQKQAELAQKKVNETRKKLHCIKDEVARKEAKKKRIGERALDRVLMSNQYEERVNEPKMKIKP